MYRICQDMKNANAIKNTTYINEITIPFTCSDLLDLYLIPNGSIGEEKLDAALRKKLEYLDTAVEELAAI